MRDSSNVYLLLYICVHERPYYLWVNVFTMSMYLHQISTQTQIQFSMVNIRFIQPFNPVSSIVEKNILSGFLPYYQRGSVLSFTY